MKILFVCTHNRCRSILAEAIFNHYANGVIIAKSAGSQPAGQVHAMTMSILSEYGIDPTHLSSQAWHDFRSWKPDVVVTVCDSAANEICPTWFDDCAKVHWSLMDPSRIEGAPALIHNAFEETVTLLIARARAVASLAHGRLSLDVLVDRLRAMNTD